MANPTALPQETFKSVFGIASGYADGSIRIWDTEKGSIETILKSGHRGAVSALRYNKIGSLLASGSKDCDIILWDVVGETGLFRLRGHRDQVRLSASIHALLQSVITAQRFRFDCSFRSCRFTDRKLEDDANV